MKAKAHILDGKKYVSAKVAGAAVDITPNYVKRLCREGHVDARVVDGTWYVNEASLKTLITKKEGRKREWRERQAEQRRGEQIESGVQARSFQPIHTESISHFTVRPPKSLPLNARLRLQRAEAVRKTIVALSISIFIFSGLYGVSASGVMTAPQIHAALAQVSAGVGDTFLGRTLCNWFSICWSARSSLTDAARDRAYEPVVVYTKSSGEETVATPTRPVSSTTQTIQNIRQPVIERIIERVTEAVPLAGSFVTNALFVSSLADLETRLNQRISSIPPPMSGGGPSAPVYINTFGLSQKIDKLDGVTITNATISGGSVTATTLSGILGIGNGGTGTSSAPSYGNVLLGNSAGGYDLVATSSLGITSSGGSASFGCPFRP